MLLKPKLNKNRFRNSRITEADFTGSVLKDLSFINCDLQRSIFRNTNLEGVDFRSSFNYSIDPSANGVKKARFSLSRITGPPDRFDNVIEE